MGLFRDKDGNYTLHCPLEWRSSPTEQCSTLGTTGDPEAVLDHLVADHDVREIAIFLMRAELENDAMRDLADLFDNAGGGGEALFPALSDNEEFVIEIAQPQ